MKRRLPLRAASWAMRRFVRGANSEALAGDIEEGFRGGRSHYWYCKEVVAAMAGGRRLLMKRISVYGLVAVGVFVTGFVARQVVPETPSPLSFAELNRPRDADLIERGRMLESLGTMIFLRSELRNVEEKYQAAPSEELKRQIELLQGHIAQAQWVAREIHKKQ